MNRMFENKPITIKPSLSIICNRKCGFCGIKRVDFKDIRERKITNFMSLEIAETLSKEIGEWLKDGVRFELGGFGEPLLNANTTDIVGLIRKYNPKSQILIYTNMSILSNSKINDLFNNGLNILFIDCYDTKSLEKAKEIISNSDLDNVTYGDSNFNPYRKGNVNRRIICYQDYTDTEDGGYDKKAKTLHNAAGNIDDIAYERYNIQRIYKPLDKMCVRPFRELVILPDGIVPLCCQDWCREVILGKIPEESLKSIWYGNLTSLIRARLYSRKRDFNPCCNCNHISRMVGLVPKPNNNGNNINGLRQEIIVKSKQWKRFKLKKAENIKFKGNVKNW